MQEISNRENSFLPGATWLISCLRPESDELVTYCGTIQGLAQPGDFGAVQNVGVVPEHRRLGLGRALVQKALIGFRDAQLSRAYLEVTRAEYLCGRSLPLAGIPARPNRVQGH